MFCFMFYGHIVYLCVRDFKLKKKLKVVWDAQLSSENGWYCPLEISDHFNSVNILW